MTSTEILQTIGQFSNIDCVLFDEHTSQQRLHKNDILVSAGEVCNAFYFVLQGSFFQFETNESDKRVVDLHLHHEWMFNQESLTGQLPSLTTIKAFSDAEVLVLSLYNFHRLCGRSQAFLQFGKILNQTKYRTFLYDHSLQPSDKYKFINTVKPALLHVFPLKMIASYLKVTPETLSRVRANY